MKINLLPFCFISIFAKQIQTILPGNWELFHSTTNTSYNFTIKHDSNKNISELHFLTPPPCCESSYQLKYQNNVVTIVTNKTNNTNDKENVFLTIPLDEDDGMFTAEGIVEMCDEEYMFMLSMFDENSFIIAISYDLIINENEDENQNILFENDFILARKIDIEEMIELSSIQKYFGGILSVILFSLFLFSFFTIQSLFQLDKHKRKLY